jgi:hypothetical protein
MPFIARTAGLLPQGIDARLSHLREPTNTLPVLVAATVIYNSTPGLGPSAAATWINSEYSDPLVVLAISRAFRLPLC